MALKSMKEMSRIYLAAILSCLFFTEAFAINWGKMVEFGTGVYVHSLRRTSDGGVILGISQSNVAKISTSGNLEWQKSGIFQAVETPDSTIAAIGAHNGSWFLTKFNKSGNIIWQKTFDFETTGSVVFMRLRAVGSKGYILAGSEFNRSSPRKCLLLRTDPKGNPLWLKKYPGFNLRDMENIGSEGFILMGRPNVTVLRVSASGELQFKGSFGFGSEEPAGIQPTIDGNFVVVSNRRTKPIQSYVTKFSNNGKILWRESLSGEPRINLTSIRSTREGYLIAGTRRAPNEPNQNLFIMQLNNNGIFQFADYFGGTPSEFGFAIATVDNHFAIAGSTIADSGDEAGFVMKFPRHENGGSFCTFFKNYEQPFKTSFVTPPPPIIPKTQIVETPQITSRDTSVPIPDANLEFTDLCN